jgi:hypothetical protein
MVFDDVHKAVHVYRVKGQNEFHMIYEPNKGGVRSFYNEHMEYEPNGCRWLIQGILRKDLKGPYPSLPWKLGIMTKVESGGEQRTDMEKCNE